MKIIGILVLIVSNLLFFCANAQNIVVGKIQNNILYAGYENKVELSTKDGRSFDIKAQKEDVINIIKDTTINTKSNSNIQNFIIRPLSLTKQKPFIYFKDPATNKIFDSISFIIKPLPSPIVYLGFIPDGGKISISDTILSYHFYDDINIDIQFEVESWELTVEGLSEIISGQGNKLNEIAKSVINNLKADFFITINVNVRYSNGELKTRKAIFKKL